MNDKKDSNVNPPVWADNDAKKAAYINVYNEAKNINDRFYIDSSKMEHPSNLYVLWIDIMGAGRTMKTSMQKSANMISKLHMSISCSIKTCCMDKSLVTIIPINDGAFIILRSKNDVINITRSLMTALASIFIYTKEPLNKFMVRGAISYGPVFLGEGLGGFVSKRKSDDCQEYFQQVAFGPPIVQAYDEERVAPPYGIAIHESARTFAPNGDTPFNKHLWPWWSLDKDRDRLLSANTTNIRRVLREEIIYYLRYIGENSFINDIHIDKINGYIDIVSQYFLFGEKNVFEK